MSDWRRTCAALMSVAALAGSSACYSYLPPPSPSAVDGQVVRVYLTPTGSDDVGRRVGANPTMLEGRVLQWSDSMLVLSVSAVGRANRDDEPWQGERVEVVSRDIDHVGVRQFDKLRSGLAVLVVGGALLIARTVGGSEGVVSTPPGGTGSGQ